MLLKTTEARKGYMVFPIYTSTVLMFYSNYSVINYLKYDKVQGFLYTHVYLNLWIYCNSKPFWVDINLADVSTFLNMFTANTWLNPMENAKMWNYAQAI